MLGFRGLKNKLPAPIKGQLLKAYGESSYLIYQNGLLYTAKVGSKAKAILQGKVVFAGPFRGMSQMVMLDHGKGSFSLYGNLSNLLVSRGENIPAGAELGQPVMEASEEKPMLYFEIRYRKRAVNPAMWLTADALR